MDKVLESVYSSKENCCGCGACVSVCPRDAIHLSEDEDGFVYPVIDSGKCVSCGKCRKVCGFGKASYGKPQAVYAAATAVESELMESSSGGIFPRIARKVLRDGGVVCGAELVADGNRVSVVHSIVKDEGDLNRLQGSKYVQSYISPLVYKTIEKYLQSGRKLLFTGTPCQVSQIRTMFGKYINLYCVDIICHGVPSQALFRAYLNEEKYAICGVVFRDKKKGWGHTGEIVVKNRNQKTMVKEFNPKITSFYHYFLTGEICRESCYKCPYACLYRAGDVTIGDYWGVQKFSPELLRENGGPFDHTKGVSCMLVNTARGEELLSGIEQLNTAELPIEKVMEINTQLRKPAEHSEQREIILRKNRHYGYAGVERYFKMQMRILKVKYFIYSRVLGRK